MGRRDFTPLKRGGSYVEGTYKGKPARVDQRIIGYAWACTGCGERRPKQSLGYELRSPASRADASKQWCPSCVVPRGCSCCGAALVEDAGLCAACISTCLPAEPTP